MTEWIMTCYDGRTYPLPTPLAWRLDYGLGDPCDGFWVRTLWTAGEEEILADGVRMTVRYQGEVVFTGVVDECLCQWTHRGCTAEISGRGLQGLLLDNQAEAADYGLATLEEILRRYVTPFGIDLALPVSLPGAAGFSVSSGSSCWKVLYQFARYHGGVTPRFDRQGRLHLEPWQDGTPVVLDETAPVTRTALRETRYGVLSQVTVKDLSGWSSQTEVNQALPGPGRLRPAGHLPASEGGPSGPPLPGPVPAGPVCRQDAPGGTHPGPPLCRLAGGSGEADPGWLEPEWPVPGPGMLGGDEREGH